MRSGIHDSIYYYRVGSGVVITTLAMMLDHSAIFMGTDINYDALETTHRTMKHNKGHIELVQAHFATPMLERMRNTIDVIIFNPVSENNSN